MPEAIPVCRWNQRLFLFFVMAVLSAHAPAEAWWPGARVDHFRQLDDDLLPTPTMVRNAAGAPGRDYWQQQVDYVIDVAIDDSTRVLSGQEQITYHNNSPDVLDYLWLQLDPNLFAPDSASALIAEAPDLDGQVGIGEIVRLLDRAAFAGGVTIESVRHVAGGDLDHTIVQTMMRVDLPEPLDPGEKFIFAVGWSYPINDVRAVGGRGGYEYFPEDDNNLYEMAQWFPRLCAYYDGAGWQNKQFHGRGEFALEFGDYTVSITMPADHIVAATGELQNPEEVLTGAQRERLALAVEASEPVFIVTPTEAEANEKSRSPEQKTWVFRAENVRDFAWASSRKFAWDALGHDVEGNHVLCMSLYPKEGEPLWSKYSTRAVAHTLTVYSRHTIPYPYPVAISVNGPVGGMEYPMICFNGPRPEKDGTYSKRTKYGLISVVIHEVGHNFFPMLLNSDERQWTWMDEGLNTFLQFLAEQEWELDYPSRRGEPGQLVDYMSDPDRVPIMTNSESLLQFGNNAYAKPATALNILRETVLGRELFDFAFKTYARRWVFKRPTPADLFRTLEDASGVDLDWFWRGWFYGTAPCDLGITGLRLYRVTPGDPDALAAAARQLEADQEPTLSELRNRELHRVLDDHPDLADFYNEFDEHAPADWQHEDYKAFLDRLDEGERRALATRSLFYVVDLENFGGLPMPVILRIQYADGTREELRIPAEIWRRNQPRVSKLLLCEQQIAHLTLDPRQETCDIDTADNHWPRLVPEIQVVPTKDPPGENPMQKQ